jgi:hypothetical protein
MWCCSSAITGERSEVNTDVAEFDRNEPIVASAEDTASVDVDAELAALLRHTKGDVDGLCAMLRAMHQTSIAGSAITGRKPRSSPAAGRSTRAFDKGPDATEATTYSRDGGCRRRGPPFLVAVDPNKCEDARTGIWTDDASVSTDGVADVVSVCDANVGTDVAWVGGRGRTRDAGVETMGSGVSVGVGADDTMHTIVGTEDVGVETTEINVETHGTAVWLRAASGGGGGEGALGGGGGGLAAASAPTAAATASAPPVSATWTAAGSAAVAALGGDGADKGDDGSMRRPNRRSMKAPKVAEGTYQLDIMAAVSGACKGCGQPKAAHIGAAFTCPVVASSAGSSESNAGVSGAMGARSRGRMEDAPDVATATAPLARPPLRGGANDMWL